ncbi:hypothetical protein PanWU01x14_331400 [Parasponia andersonii]|uniref:Transmembrane protein n=1 Tax=Parasponia andersonii TaxID=3476 RepID=A0A2P5AHL0_PARAD|nr:hypothetical protein PanWU01x14_331400 [Parasponia andersonii]
MKCTHSIILLLQFPEKPNWVFFIFRRNPPPLPRTTSSFASLTFTVLILIIAFAFRLLFSFIITIQLTRIRQCRNIEIIRQISLVLIINRIQHNHPIILLTQIVQMNRTMTINNKNPCRRP